MVAITSAPSATSSLQTVLERARLEQLRREADQEQDNAEALRAQVQQAETKVQNVRNRVRSLSLQGRSPGITYAPVPSASLPEVPPETQDFLVRMYAATSERFAASGNALKSDAQAAPVLNSQGQAIGRIVNISA